jgi:hypothetical protein
MTRVYNTMDHARNFTLNGNAPYATYELKTAPHGLPFARYTVPRDPLNPPVPDYSANTSALRARWRHLAIQYMHRYPDLSHMTEKIRTIASKKIPNPKIDLTNVTIQDTPYGEQLIKPISDEPDESEHEQSDQDEQPVSDSSAEEVRMEPPKFSELPASVFAAFDAMRDAPFSAKCDVILKIAKNKIDIQDARAIALSYRLNTITDVSGISRDLSDRLIKVLICAVSGQTYTIDQFERATSRFLTQVYGAEVLPVFIMLLYNMA